MAGCLRVCVSVCMYEQVQEKDSGKPIFTEHHTGIEHVSVNKRLKLQPSSHHKLLLTVCSSIGKSYSDAANGLM